MTERAAILGRRLFDVFPENLDSLSAAGPRELRASLQRVVAERRTDDMPTVRYDIPRPAPLGGGFEERWWSPRNSPVLGRDGNVICIVPDAIRQEATRLLRAHLGCHRVCYGETGADGTIVQVTAEDVASGLVPLLGRSLRPRDFDESGLDTLRAGQLLADSQPVASC
jgi:hypothetical protein